MLSVPKDPGAAKEQWSKAMLEKTDRVKDQGLEALRIAQAAGVKIVISTDAHSTRGLDVLRCGILQARRAGLEARIDLREGRAEFLPFTDGEFDALTFTYLLRYVDDPAPEDTVNAHKHRIARLKKRIPNRLE